MYVYEATQWSVCSTTLCGVQGNTDKIRQRPGCGFEHTPPPNAECLRGLFLGEFTTQGTLI
jgi:hypothetical protein